MKHFSWLVALLLVCSTQMSYANDCNSCGPELDDCGFCDFDFCDVTYDFHVDYLYWKLCRGGLQVEDSFVHPGYNSGWRVGGHLNYQDWSLGLLYTNLCVKSSKSGDSHKFEFQALDIDLGYTVHFDCAPIELTPFVGAKLVWIDEKFAGDNMDFDGYGLRIGAATTYRLCNWTFCDSSLPLALVAKASTGILDGSFDHSDRSKECYYIPVHELSVALDMHFSDLFCDTDMNFQIGYEVHSYGFRSFDEDRDGSFFGMGGLVARFGVAF